MASYPAYSFKGGLEKMKAVAANVQNNCVNSELASNAFSKVASTMAVIIYKAKSGSASRAISMFKENPRVILDWIKSPHFRNNFVPIFVIALIAFLGTYGLVMGAGFGAGGIVAGSLASGAQSLFYGAVLQSMGALRTLGAFALGVGGISAAAAVAVFTAAKRRERTI